MNKKIAINQFTEKFDASIKLFRMLIKEIEDLETSFKLPDL